MQSRYRTLIVLALAAALTAACTPAAGPGPSRPTTPTPTPPTTSTPGGGPTATPIPVTPASGAVPLVVYFSHDEKMQAVQRYAAPGTKALLRASLEALLNGPTDAERAQGLSSQIPAGTELLGVSITGGVAAVNLSSQYGTGGGSLSMFNRIAQVVFTATQYHSVTAVQFYLDGKKIAALGGEGIILSSPQTRADWEDQSPAILVESPGWGGVLKQGGIIRGTANVFEAVFQLEVRDPSGAVLFAQTVNATSGTGTRGRWSVRAGLSGAAVKSGTIRVYDRSAKDGAPENVIDIPVALEF